MAFSTSIDVNASREVTLIFPNRFTPRTDIGRIRANVRVAVPGPDYPDFTSFAAVEPAGKGKLIALVVPEDFAIERYAAEPQEVTKGFVPRNEPQSYLMRVIRQIDTAISTRTQALAGEGGVLTTKARTDAAIAAELRRWGYQILEYEITR